MDNITVNVRMGLIGDDLEIKENINLEIDENGIIQHIGNGKSADKKTIVFNNGILLPAFANSHVHTADFSFPEIGIQNTLKELVGDPISIKYKMFESISDDEIIEYIQQFIRISKTYGTKIIIDFREQGLKGSIIASKIKDKNKSFNYFILGRLEKREFSKENLEILRRVADGYGVSSVSSHDIEEMKIIHEYFKDKIIAIHVSETLKQNLRGDFRLAMEYLQPKLIIHGTHLSIDEILEIKEKYTKTYLVLCPRSNLWFSTGIPKISDILKNELNILIGTDNGGWINPNVLEEAEFALMISRLQEPQSDYSKEILKAITINAKEFNATPIIEGKKSSFVILEGENSGIVRAKNKYMGIIKRGKKILFTSEELSKKLK